MKPPIPNSYWVEPGRLLAGEHPDAGNSSRTRARLQKFFDAGVRHFFDLTQPRELPAYASLLPAGARHYSFAIPDHSIPSEERQMREILAALGQAQKAGGAVYVHCRAGIGRTGTVVGCWLREQGATSEGALDELNRLWQQNARSATWPSIPETDEQYSYVHGWNPVGAGLRAVADAPGRLRRAYRFRGCLVGLAIGDIQGTARVAGRPPGHDWSDDTGMTLCVAESLLACDGFDGRDQIARYREWMQDPAAAGAARVATLPPAVLDSLNRALHSRAALVGSHDPLVIDPAPLARSAAVALFAAGDPEFADSLAADVARVTHQAPLAVDASRLFACMVAAALDGQGKPAILSLDVPGMPLKEEVSMTAFEWRSPPGGRRRPPPGILGCLDRAVRAFARTSDFRAGLERLQNSSGADADATLAAYGALAGAWYGDTGLPRALLPSGAGLKQLEAHAEMLFQRTRAAGA